MEIIEKIELLLKLNQCEIQTADIKALYNIVSKAVMDEINFDWKSNRSRCVKAKQACYLSAEFLTGNMFFNNLLNLDILDDVSTYFEQGGRNINELEAIDDPALGNGGLGRLAACFLDSAANLNKPLLGYGIRYKYGLFKQKFHNGTQVELPDDWQSFGDPWSIKRADLKYKIEFKDQTVYAVAYDYPVIPYKNNFINTLRLFEAETENNFDFNLFNAGKYHGAYKQREDAENLYACLYPNDDTKRGKILRLKQEYFLVSAAVQDLLCSFEKNFGSDYLKLPDYFAAQLNDTHPVLAIPELIYQLISRGLTFKDALAVAQGTFSYTNHTIMAEALEKWNKYLLRNVIPNIYIIILNINKLLKAKLTSLDIQKETAEKMLIIKNSDINMANLAVCCCSKVNGVAKLHSEILKTDIFKDWYALYPQKFLNITNGITQRRFLRLSNPRLSELISEKISNNWITDLGQLKELEQFADDKDFIDRFWAIKQDNKKTLAQYILQHEDIQVNSNSIFDIQAKRLHEYKRQLLNAFSILYLYYGIKDKSIQLSTPVTFIFGAKAAPGYKRAKAIIKYINDIAQFIEQDSEVKDLLKVVFLQNYNVSYAQKLICAADVSEQISTAGTEASGTGNMKFMLNGTVTLGTYDGANVEITDLAGQQNNYIFGARVEQLNQIRSSYNSEVLYNSNLKLKNVIDTLIDESFSKDAAKDYKELYEALLKGSTWHNPDHYFLLYDFESYISTKLKLYNDYSDKYSFAKKCIVNMANAGWFSSDRTINQYAMDIWHI